MVNVAQKRMRQEADRYSTNRCLWGTTENPKRHSYRWGSGMRYKKAPEEAYGGGMYSGAGKYSVKLGGDFTQHLIVERVELLGACGLVAFELRVAVDRG